jgi:allophanate hydrolase
MMQADALMVPTAPRAYTVAEIEAEPIKLNANLGTYTNFVNLLDLCGLAIPVTIAGGMPYGATLLAAAGADARLLSFGRAMHAKSGLTLGALGKAQPDPLPAAPLANGETAIAVIGAHLSGMALNHELTALRGRFVEALRTTPDYRLFALAGEGPARPGMLRVSTGAGVSIEAELWALSHEAFGKFVASIPAPLSIGTVRFENGKTAKGFLVEAEAVHGAKEISSFGGWRSYVSQIRKSA